MRTVPQLRLAAIVATGLFVIAWNVVPIVAQGPTEPARAEGSSGSSAGSAARGPTTRRIRPCRRSTSSPE